MYPLIHSDTVPEGLLIHTPLHCVCVCGCQGGKGPSQESFHACLISEVVLFQKNINLGLIIMTIRNQDCKFHVMKVCNGE